MSLPYRLAEKLLYVIPNPPPPFQEYCMCQ